MKVASPPSPYKGLAAFEESALDALLFFGRERETEIVAANLLAYRLTVLYGASGVGKSSLLRAGVAHRLRQKGEEVVIFDAWSGDPTASLRECLPESPDRELYLILDQFDEYFIYHDAGDEFPRELARLVTQPDLRVNVLISIRDDMLSQLDRFKAFVPNLLSNYLRLDHLDRRSARQAIVGPLERFNALVAEDERTSAEPELVEAVLDGSGTDGHIEAPYLQLVMQRLWEEEHRAGSPVLKLETLVRLGGAEEIVRAHLSEALETLSPHDCDLAERLFNHLVTPSGTKIAYGIVDLAQYAAVSEGEVAPVLAALVDERILRPVSVPGVPDESRYEIFHDVLAEPVSAWRTRHTADRELVLERRAAKRRHRRLLAVTVASLIALAAMATVTVFALAQRHEADVQRSRAVAKAALAKRERLHALVLRDKALESKKAAQASANDAEAATKSAQVNQAAAEDAQDKAQTQTKKAEQESRKAEASARQAKKQKRIADEQTAVARNKEELANISKLQAVREAKRAKEAKGAAKTAAKKAEAESRLARAAERRARARALTAGALAAIDVDPRQSLDLALGAARLERTPRVEDALRRALIAMNLRGVLPDGGGPDVTAEFSRDGTRILVAGREQVRVYEAGGLRRIRMIRPPSSISASDLSPDGKLVAIGATDGGVRVWNVESGAPVHPGALAQGGEVTTAAFSSDGKQLLTAGSDGTARLWDVYSGQQRHVFTHKTSVVDASLSADGSHLLTVTKSRVCRLYDVESGRVRQLAHGSGAVSASFSPDGKLVATAGGDTTRIWDVATAKTRFTLGGHVNPVLTASFDPTGTRLVTTSEDGQARVWDVRTGMLMTQFVGHVNFVVDASFSPDGAWVVSASTDHTARVWGTVSGREDGVMLGNRKPVTAASFAPSGETVLTAGDDGVARVWSAHTDPLLRVLGRHGGSQGVTKASFSADGRLVVSAGKDGTARIWRVGGGSVATLRHSAAVNDAVFAGEKAVTASDDGSVRIWRARDGRLLRTLEVGAPVDALGVTRGLRMIATGGRDGFTRLWNGQGRLLAKLPQEAAVTGAAFGRGATRLVTTGADGNVRLWSVPAVRLLHVLSGHRDRVVQVAFSPNGRYFGTASRDTTARIWDARTGKLLRILNGDDTPLTSLAFSRSGNLMVTTSQGGEARIWRTRKGALARQPLHVLQHHLAIADAAFSSDSRWLVTAGAPRAHVWSVSSGRELFSPRGHVGSIRTVAFSPRGWKILSAGRDGTVRTYDCAVCAKLGGLVSLGNARLERLAATK